MPHQIRIRVYKDGRPAEIKAEGFSGPSCSLVTAPFIGALGRRVAEEATEEMYQDSTISQQQELQQ